MTRPHHQAGLPRWRYLAVALAPLYCPFAWGWLGTAINLDTPTANYSFLHLLVPAVGVAIGARILGLRVGLLRLGLGLGLVVGLALCIRAHRQRTDLEYCKYSGLHDCAEGLEQYATDNQGVYPDSLARLTPNYLKFIPACRAAGEDTYSRGYERSPDGRDYTLHCSGLHHPNPGYPYYTSREGMSPEPPSGTPR